MEKVELAEPGDPARRGAALCEGGANFAVFAEHATALDLCLFDETALTQTRRLRLHGPHTGVFHGFVPGVRAGQVYGLRAHGPWAPAQGHRFNAHKLLLDPQAREIVGHFEWRPEHHGYVLGGDSGCIDTRDNAAFALKARVAEALPTARPGPRLTPGEVLLYELHAKGFGRQHPGLPPELRGTYAGLAHPAAIAHFRRLGVTTLSLLPVFYRLSEPMMPAGLVNHWGYNTLGFFCPDPRFSCTPDDPAAVNREFRAMVDTLHAAGLQVVLDVVFNHTPEGNEQGLTISFRGLGEKTWYRLGDDGRPLNWSACGNTLNAAHPEVVRFVLDALRHWVLQMGVDGFRFDLAPVLGRGPDGRFERDGAFFTALLQDPVLSQVLLIAEPWDAGPQGYRVGDFPGPFLEWNDHFRDAARGFWLQASGATRAGFARRFDGSADTYHRHQRRPTAGVNFITAHDGFTLADLVSHSRKHNEANGEGNRDGRDDELCANLGAEGPSDDPAIVEARRRVQRALLATLLLAAGTPMLLAGDDSGNSQQGNNNAWNQDNPIGWLDWADGQDALTTFVAECVALRRDQALLRPADWGELARQQRRWLHPGDDDTGPLACEIGGHLLLVFNPEPVDAVLAPPPGRWSHRLDSTGLAPAGEAVDGPLPVPARSLQVFERRSAS